MPTELSVVLLLCQCRYESIKAKQTVSGLKLASRELIKEIPNFNMARCHKLKMQVNKFLQVPLNKRWSLCPLPWNWGRPVMVLISRICQKRHCIISRPGGELGSESPEVSNEKSNYPSGKITRTGLPQWCSGKESACNAEDMGLIPGWGISPGEGNGNPLQYSCLGNTMGRGTCWAIVYGLVEESDTTEQLNNKDHMAWRPWGSFENLWDNNDKKNTSYKWQGHQQGLTEFRGPGWVSIYAISILRSSHMMLCHWGAESGSTQPQVKGLRHQMLMGEDLDVVKWWMWRWRVLASRWK